MVKKSKRSGGSRLTREDWAAAALDVIARDGLHAVGVEQVARHLGATKGSFYWHLEDRDALIRAALELWERRDTESPIAMLAEVDDVGERFAALRALEVSGRVGAAVDLALVAAADHPAVRPVLARVLSRRLVFLEQIFLDMGFSVQEAKDRALLGFSSFLGRGMMRKVDPSMLPTARGMKLFLDRTAKLITEGTR